MQQEGSWCSLGSASVVQWTLDDISAFVATEFLCLSAQHWESSHAKPDAIVLSMELLCAHRHRKPAPRESWKARSTIGVGSIRRLARRCTHSAIKDLASTATYTSPPSLLACKALSPICYVGYYVLLFVKGGSSDAAAGPGSEWSVVQRAPSAVCLRQYPRDHWEQLSDQGVGMHNNVHQTAGADRERGVPGSPFYTGREGRVGQLMPLHY